MKSWVNFIISLICCAFNVKVTRLDATQSPLSLAWFKNDCSLLWGCVWASWLASRVRCHGNELNIDYRPSSALRTAPLFPCFSLSFRLDHVDPRPPPGDGAPKFGQWSIIRPECFIIFRSLYPDRFIPLIFHCHYLASVSSDLINKHTNR